MGINLQRHGQMVGGLRWERFEGHCSGAFSTFFCAGESCIGALSEDQRLAAIDVSNPFEQPWVRLGRPDSRLQRMSEHADNVFIHHLYG